MRQAPRLRTHCTHPADFALRLAAWALLCGSVLSCADAVPDAATPPAQATDDSSTGTTLEQRGFDQVGIVDGVTLFQADDPDMIRLGAEAILPAPPQLVQEVLLDYPKHPEVLERVAEAEILERGEGWLLVYQHLSLPIISDRDRTLRVTWGKEGDVAWIRFKATRKGPPPREGIVRLTRDFGSWELFPRDGGQATFARYESNIDMAGSLPTWMSQSSAVDELPALFAGICNLLAARGTQGPCP